MNIVYHPQLMPDTPSATLFMVANPMSFQNYEDHYAGVYLRLYELIENAWDAQENPIGLLEDYPDICCPECGSATDIANYLIGHDKMLTALNMLRQKWRKLDPEFPFSRFTKGGLSQKERCNLYHQTTLRSYLEALSSLNL